MPRGIHMRLPQHRKRIAKAMRAYVKTRQHRENISKALRGRKRKPYRRRRRRRTRKLQKLWTAYNEQKRRAHQRGIEWEPRFTFESWLKKWKTSGHLHERGRRKNEYNLSRKGDVGPYSFENTNVITHSQNSHDARYPRRH
jgi:hypothetical protein